MKPKVTIIIPFKKANDYLTECILKCLVLDYDNYSIALLPDSKLPKSYMKQFSAGKVKVIQIPTGSVHPSRKRNAAIYKIKSEFFASIDSDAYPGPEWLKCAIPFFRDKRVGAVGGPNLTPANATKREMAAIDVIYSKLGINSAYYINPYVFGKIKVNGASETKEQPSSNLIFRRSAAIKSKCYEDRLKTGEDTIFCRNLRSNGYLVLSSNDVAVYHHRRPLYLLHLSRVYGQAKDKISIIRNDFTRNDMIFLVPGLFVLYLIFGLAASFFYNSFALLYLVSLVFYILAVACCSIKKSFSYSFLVFSGIILTHLAYGFGTISGLFLEDYERK